jgi:thiol:disulfide interchange protein
MRQELKISGTWASNALTGRRQYASAAQDLADFCKEELVKVQEEKQKALDSIKQFLTKNKYKMQTTKEAVEFKRQDGNTEVTVSIWYPEEEDKHDEHQENQVDVAKQEEVDFTVQIKKGEEVFTADGWVVGETYDLDHLAFGDAEINLEQEDNELVSTVKAYLDEAAGLSEPDFPYLVCDALDLTNLEQEEKFNKGLSRFLK